MPHETTWKIQILARRSNHQNMPTTDIRVLSLVDKKWTTKSASGITAVPHEEHPSLLSSAIPPMWTAPVPEDATEATDTEKRELPCTDIRLTAFLSRLAYGDEKAIVRDAHVARDLLDNTENGFPKLLLSEDPHHGVCQMWLFPSRKEMVLVFRGSGSVGESLSDAFSSRKELQGSRGLVHGGILNQFNELQPILQLLLQEHHDKFDKLVITGHGIGGALATLAGPYFAELCSEKEFYVITYGSPRVGNDDFCRWFNEKIPRNKYRFVIEGDPLPNMPASSRYAHVQDAVCLTHEGRLFTWPETPSNKRWDIPFGSLVMYIVSSFLHNQWEYYERINTLCLELETAKRGG